MAHPVKLDLSEKEFQQNIIDLARLSGHLVYHTHDSRRSGKGFPDLVIVSRHMERPLFVELKTKKGKLTNEQWIWQQVLRAIPGADYRFWRPSDWPEIEVTLTGRKSS